MHDKPIGAGDDDRASTAAQDLHDQGVVLIQVLTIYPTQLRLLELVREIPTRRRFSARELAVDAERRRWPRRQSVSVERIERKGGAVWRVRWRDEQGQAHSKVIGRKRDAETFDAEVLRRKRTGDLDLLTGGSETLADFAEEWWKLYAVPNLASRTLRGYAGLWDRHVLPRLGAMRLNTITVEAVERYRAELEGDGVGQPTIYQALALLQGVLRRAVEWRRISHNPVKSVRKPNVRRQREVRPVSPSTVERLRAVAVKRRRHGPRDAVLIGLLAYAGARPQETLVLRWSDVRERTLLVEKADGQGGVKTTKTGQARTSGSLPHSPGT